jgi:proteasome lid subunit RPN8/RPN11
MTYPFKEAFEDAKDHARREYPKESCGLIVKGKYYACENIADDPARHDEGNVNCGCQLCSFEINPKVYATYEMRGPIDVVVHSHPNGPYYPSLADMEGQALTAKTWAILCLDEERAFDKPVMWGGDLPIPPIVGREFMHGITDCYAIIKDAYALGKDKLAEQGVVWPFLPITLPDCPREDAWWEGERDLYEENFEKAGFIEVTDPKPGDVFLMKIRSSKNNHGGLLVGEGLILHHLPSRLSRREPAGLWGRQASKWLRYKGATYA